MTQKPTNPITHIAIEKSEYRDKFEMTLFEGAYFMQQNVVSRYLITRNALQDLKCKSEQELKDNE